MDAQVKAPYNASTVGCPLCKSKNRVVAEYVLRDTNKPTGVAEAPPKDLEASLPRVEQIERDLRRWRDERDPRTRAEENRRQAARP